MIARLSCLALMCVPFGCAGIPWGQGGAEPPRATTGAFVRTFDDAALAAASERLAELVTPRWASGLALAELPLAPGDLAIDWRQWLVAPGVPRLELLAEPPPVMHSEGGSSVDFGLVAHVPLATSEHEIRLWGDGLDAPCDIHVVLAAGELDIPMGFTADKLGRVLGVVLPGAAFRASNDVTPNAILKADLSDCGGGIEPGASLAALGSAFGNASVRAVSDALNAELPAAVGLDLAFAWSGSVRADAIGSGFMRTALRVVVSDLVRRQAEAVQVAYALTVEADAHPCMGALTLAVPAADTPEVALPPGAALHIGALERFIDAAWLGGAACADHLGAVPVEVSDLTHFWPALGDLGEGAEASLELWPSALPRVSADPAMLDALLFESGHMRVDVIVTFAGARWRAASVELELDVSGQVSIDGRGAVLLDPARVEARPTTVDPGLLGAPTPEAIAALTVQLVEALVLDRPLAQLPPNLTPGDSGAVVVGEDYLTWPTR